jgi:hypothetical protein
VFAYLVTAGNIDNWSNLGEAPYETSYYYPGGLYSTVLLHPTKFTDSEFSAMCYKTVQDFVPELVENSLIEEGKHLVAYNYVETYHTIYKYELVSTIYNGLIKDYGFISPEKATSFLIKQDVQMPMDTTKKIPKSKSTTIMRAVKMWCYDYLTAKRKKALE